MLRVYKDFIRRMLLVCLHYRDSGYTLRHAHVWTTENWWKHSNSKFAQKDTARDVKQALAFLEAHDYPPNEGTLDSLIKTCTDLLLSSNQYNDRDLIDAIVRLLGLPFARNTLAGSTLTHLKQALLVPEEIADLRVKLEQEKFCASCGHPFKSGEMATFIVNGDARSFNCTRCCRPSWIASDNVTKTSISIDSLTDLSKALLKKRLSEPAAPEADADAGGIQALADDILGANLPPAAHPADNPDIFGAAVRAAHIGGRQWVVGLNDAQAAQPVDPNYQAVYFAPPRVGDLDAPRQADIPEAAFQLHPPVRRRR